MAFIAQAVQTVADSDSMSVIGNIFFAITLARAKMIFSFWPSEQVRCDTKPVMVSVELAAFDVSAATVGCLLCR